MFSIRGDRSNKCVTDKSKYASSCKACASLNSRLKAYGISYSEFQTLREECGDCCSICNKHESEVRNKKAIHYGLYVDHDHSTGVVRGLLCHSCNLILGHSLDDIQTLKNAIIYLSRDEIV